MKKLVLMFVAIAAVSFASCGNKAADAEKATADSIRIADSIAAVEAAAAEDFFLCPYLSPLLKTNSSGRQQTVPPYRNRKKLISQQQDINILTTAS